MKEQLNDNCKAVHKAMIEQAWKIMEPQLRTAARDLGYAIALHGSLARDLDLVAIPWTEQSNSPDYLVETLVGVLRGIFGRANTYSEWTSKPHGRKARTVLLWLGHGLSIDLDISVMPLVKKEFKAVKDKYQADAARMYQLLYPKQNFHSKPLETQRQWMNAMKDFLNETGSR